MAWGKSTEMNAVLTNPLDNIPSYPLIDWQYPLILFYAWKEPRWFETQNVATNFVRKLLLCSKSSLRVLSIHSQMQMRKIPTTTWTHNFYSSIKRKTPPAMAFIDLRETNSEAKNHLEKGSNNLAWGHNITMHDDVVWLQVYQYRIGSWCSVWDLDLFFGLGHV